MCARISHILTLAAVSLFLTMESHNAAYALAPLPTHDIKRITSSITAAMRELEFYKKEIETHLQYVKMIQNGGFKAAATALFNDIDSGRYNSYSEHFQKGVEATQDAISEKYAIRRMMKEEAAKMLKEDLEAVAKAEKSGKQAIEAGQNAAVDKATSKYNSNLNNYNSSELNVYNSTLLESELGDIDYNNLTKEQEEKLDKLKAEITGE